VLDVVHAWDEQNQSYGENYHTLPEHYVFRSRLFAFSSIQAIFYCNLLVYPLV